MTTIFPAAARASYPLRGGNALRHRIDGVPAFRAIADAVAAARSSVWVTVAFLDEDLVLPGGHGGFFDLLEAAARRGCDVRALFWSEPEIESMLAGSAHFPAGPRAFETLGRLAPGVLARWDRLRGYCHHQKSWIVDAGTDAEVAFVGGINLDRASMVSPGHPPSELPDSTGIHDVYMEMRGPSASDVHHNFVQRWNEASERDAPLGCFPSRTRCDDLPFPREASREAGDSLVQVARTVRAGAYRVGHPAAGAAAHPIAEGERSILEQYLAAVDGARRSIYLENQILLCPDLFASLDAALKRGVRVLAVVPATAMPEIARVRTHPRVKPVFDMLDAFGGRRGFTLAALGTTRGDGSPAEIYVHSKVAVVDDEWATVGSANAMLRSFRDDTELNATTWDPHAARSLREDLFAEHLGGPCREDDDRRAVEALADAALENRERRREGRPLRGQVFAIEPRDWARTD